MKSLVYRAFESDIIFELFIDSYMNNSHQLTYDHSLGYDNKTHNFQFIN